MYIQKSLAESRITGRSATAPIGLTEPLQNVHSLEDILIHARTGRFSTKKKYPWEVSADKTALFRDERMRLAAIKWIVFCSDGDLKNIKKKDFELKGILEVLEYYHRSVYWAFVTVGYAHSLKATIKHSENGLFDDWKVYPWEMERTPRGIYLNKQIRIAAVKWLMSHNLNPCELLREDFINSRLGGLLATYYKDQPYLALVESGFAYSSSEIKSMATTETFGDAKVYPWEMTRTPDIVFKDIDLQKAAIKWLAWVCKKAYRDLDFEDFKKYLRGFTSDCSAFDVLYRLGFVAESDREYMSRNRPRLELIHAL
jgi:hypothetical protein